MLQRNHQSPATAAGILIMLCVAWTAPAEESLNTDGYVVMRDGKTVNFARVNTKTLGFVYGPEDKRTSVPVSDIAAVTFGENSGSAIIELKDGRTIEARSHGSSGGYPVWESSTFYFQYFDDVARTLNSRDVTFFHMSKLVIGDHVGRFRRCPHCNAFWPDNYLFCPQDGVRTVWGESSGALTADLTATPAQRAERSGNVMEAILNASLARSGVDPASEEAKQAKEFGKLWMNPLADPKEIHRKLDELRGQFQNSEPKR